MPAAAAPPTGRPQGRQAGQPAPQPLVPFTAAAHEHTEPIFDVTVTPGTSAQTLASIDIPAYGFLRHIYLDISASGGALGGGALAGDYPYNIFSSIALNDVNGAPIFGPLDGYAAMITNIMGGYGFNTDPRRGPNSVQTINAVTYLRVPVEISHHDGFGALANQNAAASYKLALTVNSLANLVTGGAPTAPAIRIRGYLEAWSLPNEVDVVGRPQAQFPPVHGTTSYHSQNVKAVAVGQNTIPLVRVGNLIRSVAFIARNSSGVRTDGVFPDPAQLNWDARSLLLDTQQYRSVLQWERSNNLLNNDVDAGVFIYSFNHSTRNAIGDDNPTLWLPTVQSTRLELVGTVATAGNIQIITNDVAPAEVIPAERFVETSGTGFHPALGAYNAQAQ